MKKQTYAVLALIFAVLTIIPVFLTVKQPTQVGFVSTQPTVFSVFNTTFNYTVTTDDGFFFCKVNDTTISLYFCNFTDISFLFNITTSETVKRAVLSYNGTHIICAYLTHSVINVTANGTTFITIGTPDANFLHIVSNGSIHYIAYTTNYKYHYVEIYNDTSSLKTWIFSKTNYYLRDVAVSNDKAVIAIVSRYYFNSYYYVLNTTDYKRFYRYGRVVGLWKNKSVVQSYYLMFDEISWNGYRYLGSIFVRGARCFRHGIATTRSQIVFFYNKTTYTTVELGRFSVIVPHTFYAVGRTSENITVITFDYDSDCLNNIDEYIIGTDIYDSDTDDDGLDDGCEVSLGTSPLLNDTDEDGLDDKYEVIISLTNPLSNDTDTDGLDDYKEINVYGTDPHSNDTDCDGLDDYLEVTLGTNPVKKDTDGDFLDDGVEINFGSDPTVVDTDNDNLTDFEEFIMRTDPTVNDTDADELSDYYEVLVYHTDPTRNDTDGDGWSDYYEITVSGTDPNDPDTDDDGVLDPYDQETTTTPPQEEEHEETNWTVFIVAGVTVLCLTVLLLLAKKRM